MDNFKNFDVLLFISIEGLITRLYSPKKLYIQKLVVA